MSSVEEVHEQIKILSKPSAKEDFKCLDEVHEEV